MTRRRLWVPLLTTLAVTAVVGAIAQASASVRPNAGPMPAEVPAAPAEPLPGPLTDQAADSPSGVLGSGTNPLGSPRRSLATCDAQPTSASGALSVSVSNSGFSQDCYRLSLNAPTAVQLTDTATNAATGLTIPVELALTTLTKPVVTQVAGSGQPRQMPGLTVPSDPEPYVDLRNALFTSPTAPDTNPVSFTLPPLAVGHYLLQLPTLPLAPAAVITVAVGTSPPAPAAPPVTTSTTIASTADVKVPTATTADRQALEAAFATWERLPATCPGSIVPNSDRYALVRDVEWAMATFGPAATCTQTLAPATAGGPTRSVDPMRVGPFAETNGLPVAVFEKQPGGSWVMNEEGGSPFPCPAAGGMAPGPGNGAVPAPALAAWGLSYAANCAFPSYPSQPRTRQG